MLLHVNIYTVGSFWSHFVFQINDSCHTDISSEATFLVSLTRTFHTDIIYGATFNHFLVAICIWSYIHIPWHSWSHIVHGLLTDYLSKLPFLVSIKVECGSQLKQARKYIQQMKKTTVMKTFSTLIMLVGVVSA